MVPIAAIEINIDPNLLRIGPLLFSWHGLFGAIGVMAGMWLPGRMLTNDRVTTIDKFYPVAWWAVIGGLIGARLLYVLEHWSQFAASPGSILAFSEGGASVFGGFLAGAVVGAVMARRAGIPLGKFADAGGAGMALGQAIGRIGDVINGEHHGTHWDGPLSVVYTHPNTLGERGVPVHLAVGYEMVLDLLLCALLVRLYGRLRPGMAFWVFFAGYSAIRLIVGFFRQDTIVAWGLGQAQLLGVLTLPICALALVLLATNIHRRVAVGH
jgi:phosphatidylglycerol:prolipoprotein diacylglycerol transferase